MFRISNVKVENGLDISTILYFSTFNLKYFEFKIWFESNLTNYTVTQLSYMLLTMQLCSFHWWPAALFFVDDT